MNRPGPRADRRRARRLSASALALAATIAATASAAVHGPALAGEGATAPAVAEARAIAPPAPLAPSAAEVAPSEKTTAPAPRPAPRPRPASEPEPTELRLAGDRLEIARARDGATLASRHVGRVDAMTLTEDGAVVALALPHALQLYEATSLRHLATIPLDAPVVEARFLGRGRTLAMRDAEGGRTTLRLAAILGR